MNSPFAFPHTLTLADSTALLTWLPSITMITGILVLGAIMAMSFNRRERQLRTLAAQISSDLEEAKALRSQLDEAHTLASNMMVTAQRLSARLDERVAALDMASLRMSATRNALPRPPHLGARNAAHRIEGPPRTHAASATVAAEPDMALSPVLSSIEHAMAPAKVAAGAQASVEMKPHLDPFARHVYELADTGQPAVAIARELNEHVGKIELILALRR